MKIPPKPPGLKEQLQDNVKLAALLVKSFEPEVQAAVRAINDDYLHWDKVRFRETPLGLTAKELWFVTKTTRGAGKQPVPLSFSSKDKSLYYVSPPKHLEWIHHIDKQGGGTIGVTGHSTLGDESDRYLVNSLMEEAIASSQLEGASTTRKVAKEMLRAGRKPITDAEKMIMNNYRAILEVRDLKKESLTPKLLCHLQSVLTEDTLDNPDAVGRFRRGDEAIEVVDNVTGAVLHTPPPADELEWRIKEICDFANSISNPFVHPVVKASILHFAIGYVHPFVDGNGRTARALFYWYMLKRDYWLFEYFPISRVLVRSPGKYGRAYLYTETDGGDATYFIRYNIQAILIAMREFYVYVAREEQAAKEAASLLESFPGLNQRQRFLIHDALKNPGMSCTFNSYEGKYHVTNPTARADLLGLVQIGLLQQDKGSKTHIFHPAVNLRELLHLPPSVVKAEKIKMPKPIAVTTRKPTALPKTSTPKTTKSNQPPLFE